VGAFTSVPRNTSINRHVRSTRDTQPEPNAFRCAPEPTARLPRRCRLGPWGRGPSPSWSRTSVELPTSARVPATAKTCSGPSEHGESRRSRTSPTAFSEPLAPRRPRAISVAN
jgi:hypothetical protein